MRAVLSPAAYRSAWEKLDLGAMPIVLYVEEPGEPSELADHLQGDELDPWLVAAFKLLANPPLSVDLRLGFGSTSVRALAAHNVLAVLTRDAMTISEVDDPVEALTSLLPEQPGELRAQFGAAVVDGKGRRQRAADVVDWEAGVTQEALKARISAMVDTIRSIVEK